MSERTYTSPTGELRCATCGREIEPHHAIRGICAGCGVSLGERVLDRWR